ncbi:hypothetical protein BO99DRAFT_263597 [Aspergillus violaceofuscus CBS 115571]|uniref:Uncharacterized protein n=1 Tax=Aspergillus violaceofuscus (strain CBS 115571) TaxID=1450538 RepID=A0A2V5H0K0_ASPV1|nr:hypothetical protein BO99DRAFT_263597 [Aspergillus violaceofuscus CBS 115571]
MHQCFFFIEPQTQTQPTHVLCPSLAVLRLNLPTNKDRDFISRIPRPKHHPSPLPGKSSPH